MRASAAQSSKSKSYIPINDVFHTTSNGKSVQLFADNRPETVTQRKLKNMANNGQHAQPVAQLQSLVNHAVQRQKSEEEELLQGKFKTIQRQVPEEEELIQGKFKTVQRKEPEEEELLQGKFKTIQRQELEEEEPLQGKFQPIQKKGNNTGLPDNLKSGIENLSGMGMDDVKVHYNSDKPASLQAHAYAQGTDIHVAPGQEKHLPHEAWHVVQQKQGRVKPTMQMKGNVNVNDDKGLEKEADVMGEKAFNTLSKNILHNKSSSIANSKVIQGYFLGAANTSVSSTVSQGQDRQVDNSFRDPTDLTHSAIATSGSDPTLANSLKISEDGKLAIENTNGNRQAKIFFAEAGIVARSNKILLEKGSKYILQVATAAAITITDAKGKLHTLEAIEPVLNPDQGKKSTPKKVASRLGGQQHGNAVDVEATCIAVAEAIMNKKYGYTAELNVNLKKLGALSTMDAIQWAAVVADAMTKNGKRKNGAINEDVIAQAYGIFVNQNPAAADKMAKKLGVNEFASPKVGESYISESMGTPGATGITNWLVDDTGATDTDLMTNDATVRGGKKRSGWGNHAGAVVATSAGNNITMENYARSGEDAALKDSDKIFYFAMYGPPSMPIQTWHATWSRGTTPIANAVTGVLK